MLSPAPCNLPTVLGLRMLSLSLGLLPILRGEETEDPGEPPALHTSIASDSGNSQKEVRVHSVHSHITRTGASAAASVLYPSSFPSKSAQVPLSRHNGCSCPRQQGAPEAEARATRGGGSTSHGPGAAAEGARLPSPLESMSDMMFRDARIPNPGPTVHLTARGRRLTPKAEGHARSLSGGPGLGVPRHPHPRQSRASEQEPGSTAWRGCAAWGPLWCSASTAQSAESGREGPRAPAGGAAHLPTLRPTPPGGDQDPGAEQAGGPGTGQSSAGSRTSHSEAGGWLSRGALAG